MRTAYWNKTNSREDEVRVKDIIAEVADEFFIFPSDIVGKRRQSKVVAARQKAMWRARHETNSSYLKLARIFSRDHTTVIHNVKCWQKRISGPTDGDS
jgi:chromosomal replication initiator protein